MKYYYLFLLSTFVLFSCGKDDDYSPTDDTTTDTVAPTVPQNLQIVSVSETSAQISWEAATDNTAVTGYTVYVDENEVAAIISGTTATITGLSVNTTYIVKMAAEDEAGNVSAKSSPLSLTTVQPALQFTTTLSQMGVFTGALAALSPAAGVQLYEINSTLFTDYAQKQRLIRLPENTALQYNGNDLLPVFPDNTLIAKTFYYHIDDRNPSLGKNIIETRIFLKINGVWEVGDYIWNSDQTEATYTENGSGVPISYIDMDGNTQNINYLVPSKQDCFTCHNNNGTTYPIGMKLRSMNFTPSYTNQNQVDLFIANGLLEGIGSSASIGTLPDWTDAATYDIFERGRAYIDINCAHCHQPGGTVNNFALDFRYETPFDDTGIFANRGEIEQRIQSNLPTYRMPQLGRTIVHEEAVTMLLQYLQDIED